MTRLLRVLLAFSVLAFTVPALADGDPSCATCTGPSSDVCVCTAGTFACAFDGAGKTLKCK